MNVGTEDVRVLVLDSFQYLWMLRQQVDVVADGRRSSIVTREQEQLDLSHTHLLEERVHLHFTFICSSIWFHLPTGSDDQIDDCPRLRCGRTCCQVFVHILNSLIKFLRDVRFNDPCMVPLNKRSRWVPSIQQVGLFPKRQPTNLGSQTFAHPVLLPLTFKTGPQYNLSDDVECQVICQPLQGENLLFPELFFEYLGESLSSLHDSWNQCHEVSCVEPRIKDRSPLLPAGIFHSQKIQSIRQGPNEVLQRHSLL